MERYLHFLELQLARARTRLILYQTRLERAKAARLTFPDNAALTESVTTYKDLVGTAERDIDELSGKLAKSKSENSK